MVQNINKFLQSWYFMAMLIAILTGAGVDVVLIHMRVVEQQIEINHIEAEISMNKKEVLENYLDIKDQMAAIQELSKLNNHDIKNILISINEIKQNMRDRGK